MGCLQEVQIGAPRLNYPRGREQRAVPPGATATDEKSSDHEEERYIGESMAILANKPEMIGYNRESFFFNIN
jgi:hypothetical protein